jgi:hypothetical protein
MDNAQIFGQIPTQKGLRLGGICEVAIPRSPSGVELRASLGLTRSRQRTEDIPPLSDCLFEQSLWARHHFKMWVPQTKSCPLKLTMVGGREAKEASDVEHGILGQAVL